MEIYLVIVLAAVVLVGGAAFFIGKKSVHIPDRSSEIAAKDARIEELLVQVRDLTSQRDVSRANEENARKQLEEEKENAKPTEKSVQPKATYRTETKRKLTFKERKEYESLEPEIMALEEEKNLLEQEMSSGMLDNDTLLAKSRRIQEVIELIDEKTNRWVELSEFA